MSAPIVLFFGANDRPYGLFSNFAECPFHSSLGPVITSEQLFMMFKAAHFNDRVALELLKNAADPKAAKRLGRQVRGFDEASWSAVRLQYMIRALAEKFGAPSNTAARALLVGTGNAVIAEASPFDTIWGIGYGKNNPLAKTGPWRGQNLLGQALMTVREQLR